jgi:hypothetical protein
MKFRVSLLLVMLTVLSALSLPADEKPLEKATYQKELVRLKREKPEE